MTIEEAKEEMDQALQALQTAQQHLLEATTAATQNLSDIKKILGFEQPPLKVISRKTLLEDVTSMKSRKRSTESLIQELEQLELSGARDKQTAGRKAQIRYMLKKREIPTAAVPEVTLPGSAPEEPVPEEKPEAEVPAQPVEVKPQDPPETEKRKAWKVIVYEKGYWTVKGFHQGRKEADEDAARYLINGQDARVKAVY